MEKTYMVDFLIKKNGETRYFVCVKACNKKSAIDTAKNLWYENRISHMFHLKAHRMDETKECSYLLNSFYRLREY